MISPYTTFDNSSPGFLTLAIGINILTGAINMRGLIVDKATGRLSPGSAQSAVLAVMSAAVT